MARTTVALVHGAFADSSSWSAVSRVLRSIGYPTIAIPNLLRSLTHDARYVRSVLATLDGEVVLVGHGYGGAVISNAARDLDNVRALVFVAAYMPDQGESIASLCDSVADPGTLLGPETMLVRPCSNTAALGGLDLDIYVRPDEFHRVVAEDVPVEAADLMAVAQRPLSVSANTGASDAPAWRDVPSWALVTERDRVVSPALQHFMADRAHADVEAIDSSHAVMLSQPLAVVDSIIAADRETKLGARDRSRRRNAVS